MMKVTTSTPRCRFCRQALTQTFVDLGTSPLCQRHVRPEELPEPELFHPLHAWVCDNCFLVQIERVVTPEALFATGDYAYFSSYSTTWLAHARRYCEQMRTRFGLNAQHRVIELASNDGYLLQNFVETGIPALGIEPAANCAAAAREKGIETIVAFFGVETARQVLASHGPADLLVGNNVLAHVPDINDFVAGIKVLLSPSGVLTMEFPHLLRLVDENQFDTIYHEHYSYLSFCTVEAIFAKHGLELFDVEELPTHGGSLRIFGRHTERRDEPRSSAVSALKAKEEAAGMRSIAYYQRFGEKVHETKRALLAFLIEAARAEKRVAGYGAPGKGNTLLNYCGIRTDLIEYTVDRSPHKQGNYLPGSRIPIYAPSHIFETQPDYVVILPWNLKDEIIASMAKIRDWGGRFVIPIPTLQVLE